jgi:hypothetical protein
MNQEIVLPNSTAIRYRQLRIPCCEGCNNRHLSKIEREVRLAFDQGPEDWFGSADGDGECSRELPDKSTADTAPALARGPSCDGV